MLPVVDDSDQIVDYVDPIEYEDDSAAVATSVQVNSGELILLSVREGVRSDITAIDQWVDWIYRLITDPA